METLASARVWAVSVLTCRRRASRALLDDDWDLSDNEQGDMKRRPSNRIVCDFSAVPRAAIVEQDRARGGCSSGSTAGPHDMQRREWLDRIDVEGQTLFPQEGRDEEKMSTSGEDSSTGLPPPPPGRSQRTFAPEGSSLGNMDPTTFQAWHQAASAEETVACIECATQAVLKLSASSVTFSPTDLSRLADGLVLNMHMVYLRLHHCGLDCGSAAAIATALRSNSTLRSLSLECNKIGTLGARSFAEMLQVNDELESLTLRQNVICKHGVTRLVSALEENYSLRFLDLQCNPGGNTMKAEIQNLLKRNKAPTRVVTLHATREPGSPIIVISCVNLGGEELLRYEEPVNLKCSILRARIASALHVPRHRLGLASPKGQLLGRWMDGMTIGNCLGLTEQ